MNLPFDFEHYLDNGIAKKVSPNLPRANFLVSESSKSKIGLDKRIEKMGIDEFNANSVIKDAHDIIIELIRAKMLIDGFSASGNFAHEAEVSYLKKLNFKTSEIIFVNDLRAARNGITYYGKLYDIDYARRVIDFLNKIYPHLEKLLKQNL